MLINGGIGLVKGGEAAGTAKTAGTRDMIMRLRLANEKEACLKKGPTFGNSVWTVFLSALMLSSRDVSLPPLLSTLPSPLIILYLFSFIAFT